MAGAAAGAVAGMAAIMAIVASAVWADLSTDSQEADSTAAAVQAAAGDSMVVEGEGEDTGKVQVTKGGPKHLSGAATPYPIQNKHT